MDVTRIVQTGDVEELDELLNINEEKPTKIKVKKKYSSKDKNSNKEYIRKLRKQKEINLGE